MKNIERIEYARPALKFIEMRQRWELCVASRVKIKPIEDDEEDIEI